MTHPYGELLDIAAYKEAEQRFQTIPEGAARSAFIVAWSGVGARMRSLARHLLAFKAAMLAPRQGAPVDEVLFARLEQKEHLFGVVVNGQAAVENCCYMSYSLYLAEVPQVTEKLLRQDYRRQIAALASVQRLEALARLYSDAVAAGQWAMLEELRDAMMHRGTIPLVHQLHIGAIQDYKVALVGNPKALPENWNASMAYNPECLSQIANWVADTVANGLEGVNRCLKRPV